MIGSIRHLLNWQHLASERYKSERFCKRYDAWKRCCYDNGGFAQKIFPAIKPNGVCVELGAGTGFLTRILAKECTKVYAYDRAGAMIDFAKKQFELEGITNVEFDVCDHMSVNPKEKADLVVAGWSLLSSANPNWELEWLGILNELVEHTFALLNDRGTFAVITTASMFGELPPGQIYLPRRKMMLEALQRDYGFIPHFVDTRWVFDSVRHKRRMLRFWGGRGLVQQGSPHDNTVKESVAVYIKRI